MSAFFLAPSLPLNFIWSAFSAGCRVCTAQHGQHRSVYSGAASRGYPSSATLAAPGSWSHQDLRQPLSQTGAVPVFLSDFTVDPADPPPKGLRSAYENETPHFRNITWAAKPAKVNCTRSCYGSSRIFGKSCPKEAAGYTGIIAPFCWLLRARQLWWAQDVAPSHSSELQLQLMTLTMFQLIKCNITMSDKLVWFEYYH